jgi:predicted nucleic acid-binding protein
MTDPRYVLDSYAILTLLKEERGAERVAAILQEALRGNAQVGMSLINLGEVAYIVERRWNLERARDVLAYLDSAGIEFFQVTRERVLAVAHLKARYPIAYADAFAAALAQEQSAILVTGDPEFRALAERLAIEWLAGPN